MLSCGLAHELNDFHGVALHLPHVCGICDKKVFDLKVSHLRPAQAPLLEPGSQPPDNPCCS